MNNVKSWEQMQAEARMAAQQNQARVAQLNQGRAPQMYAGGDAGFNERTGQRMPAYGFRDWFPEPRNGDSYLAMLMNKYGGAAQGAWGDAKDWFQGRMPFANRQYMDYRRRAIDNAVDGE